ncbi:serine protease AprX [Clostridium tepidiprofundi DSM 19306]|uniref:Serine protease AprX n=1 Tax=Clostridium tepidiprofundi DSM 19306 TaxID=1121338 RepID=A0A151B3D7_9CLOT|nr:S8 family serine peptidase [Clostridium tepidiprofundi]KYH34434.1 serine protease AprX [Clostridium tepidiprofundi DSM 19306]
MNRGFKRKIGLFLVTMFVIFTLFPTTFLAVESDSNPHMIYLKGKTINPKKIDKPSKELDKINIKDKAKVKDNTNLKDIIEDSMDLYIVAFNGPIKEYMKEGAKKTGAELIEYVPDFSFLARISPENVFDILQLPYVENVIMYMPEFKINSFFKDSSGNIKKDQEGIVKIATVGNSSILDDYIENFGGKKLNSYKNEVIIRLNFNKLEDFARLNSVKYIEPVVEHVLYNDKAKDYMGVNDIWNLGYDGSGQVIGICDTGLDTGVNDNSMHLDFQGRIDEIYALGRNTADDPHGHGTHVAGSAAGNGARSNGQFKGIAPKAHIVFQSVLDSNGGLGGLPSDLNNLFEQARQAGARIHTNSWGAPVNGQYNAEARDVDEFVWNNNDMIILFAAGNEGDGDNGSTVYNSISSPGTSKNCITVGASENYRPNMPQTRWGNVGDNVDEIAAFSSRGNCEDGRIKPDIVAPGTWILSTKSSVAPETNYWQGYNDYYAYMGGTSMATPLTAGAVAVARQYMQQEWNHTPSAAMMKAAIINGGTDLGFGYPSRDQGWGRISLVDSLKSKEYKYSDQEYSLNTGDTQTFSYSIEDSNTPLKITLVWSDYPGSVTASKALVNDLDIKVISPSGTIYYGNDFTSPYDSTHDRLNNVENVYINNPETGNYTVEVRGYNVPQGPQTFALFSSANFGTSEQDNVPPTCSITYPNNGDALNGTITITASAQDDKAMNKVEFYIDGTKIGEDSSNPYSIDWDTTTVTNGNHTIMVKAIDTSGNVGNSNEITVSVDNNSSSVDYKTETFNKKASIFRTSITYIDVTAEGRIDINLDQNSLLQVELYDPNNNLVAYGDNSISYDAHQTGQYVIAVYASSIFSTRFTLQVKYPVAVN